ncbi:hypothetical protein H0H81_011305 [Sphagnurus paluster]|uniref:Dihydroxyacetone kinase n=1 Tax=Sphagnurus paluster TaxID=117069 RepID=A0A9P7GHJ6_9AGAR|nr:hypothetical protein H0H81_011305 [Sphagnurus paluster]
MSIQNKHFLNDPSSLVLDSLRGLCAINPKLVLDEKNKSGFLPLEFSRNESKRRLWLVVYLGTHDRSKVALLCGGGSGHEPAHAGFVGEGILTGAVCGSVFASPNASQVRRGIELIESEKGTVIIVKNYTGDVLNFGLAKEQYASLHPEQANQVKFVIVGDDVAVGKTQGSIVGRRGLAGTVLVYKIAGALASRGESLEKVYNIAQWVASNVATIGVGLDHCHVPGTAKSSSHLQDSEIEIGMGIHNESGNRRLHPNPPLNELIPELLDLLTSTTDPERSFLPFQGQEKLDETTPTQSLLLSLLDEQADAPGWKWSSHVAPSAKPQLAKPAPQIIRRAFEAPLKAADPASFKASIERACSAVIGAEPEITRMDTIAGDAVLKKLSQNTISGEDLVGSVIAIAQVAEETMGGTSGALYSIFFFALAQGLQSQPNIGIFTKNTVWCNALTYALNQLYTYTRARPPSRTLVDPLAAFIEAFAQNSGADPVEALNAAVSAAERTRDIEAKAGRSAYVEGNRLKQERVADPGAWGVKTILESLLN